MYLVEIVIVTTTCDKGIKSLGLKIFNIWDNKNMTNMNYMANLDELDVFGCRYDCPLCNDEHVIKVLKTLI